MSVVALNPVGQAGDGDERERTLRAFLPLALYEIGRALGLAVVGLTNADALGIVITVVMMVGLVFAGLCARSAASESYVASRTMPGS